jgi:L-arabinose isomerase
LLLSICTPTSAGAWGSIDMNFMNLHRLRMGIGSSASRKPDAINRKVIVGHWQDEDV